MRSFQKRLPEFEQRGIRVLGISVDPVETSQRHRRKKGYTFPFLSDPQAEVIRRYDLLHRGGGPGNSDIARPAEFLIDPRGTIQWVNLTADAAVRARPDQVLQAFNDLNGKSTP